MATASSARFPFGLRAARAIESSLGLGQARRGRFFGHGVALDLIARMGGKAVGIDDALDRLGEVVLGDDLAAVRLERLDQDGERVARGAGDAEAGPGWRCAPGRAADSTSIRSRRESVY